MKHRLTAATAAALLSTALACPASASAAADSSTTSIPVRVPGGCTGTTPGAPGVGVVVGIGVPVDVAAWSDGSTLVTLAR